MRLDDAGLPARVLVVEPTGSEAQMVVDVGGQNLTCLFRHRIDARPGEAIAIVPELTGRPPPSDAASLKGALEDYRPGGLEIIGLEGDQFDMGRIKLGLDGLRQRAGAAP